MSRRKSQKHYARARLRMEERIVDRRKDRTGNVESPYSVG